MYLNVKRVYVQCLFCKTSAGNSARCVVESPLPRRGRVVGPTCEVRDWCGGRGVSGGVLYGQLRGIWPGVCRGQSEPPHWSTSTPLPQNCRDEEFPFRKDAFPAHHPPRDAYHNAPALLVGNGLVTWPWRVRGLEVCA